MAQQSFFSPFSVVRPTQIFGIFKKKKKDDVVKPIFTWNNYFQKFFTVVFFYVSAFGLRVSGLGSDTFFLFFDLILLFLYTAFGLRTSGLSFDGFFFIFY